MNDNPTMVIELGSHTDSRGSDSYNLQLSQKRAESAVAYIVSKGIDQKRITAKGYGETKPVNHCVNGTKCSDAEFQLNRRTEFAIIRY
ncbi:Photosystem I chlorophyll a apoprotein A2 [compost metagenome]